MINRHGFVFFLFLFERNSPRRVERSAVTTRLIDQCPETGSELRLILFLCVSGTHPSSSSFLLASILEPSASRPPSSARGTSSSPSFSSIFISASSPTNCSSDISDQSSAKTRAVRVAFPEESVVGQNSTGLAVNRVEFGSGSRLFHSAFRMSMATASIHKMAAQRKLSVMTSPRRHAMTLIGCVIARLNKFISKNRFSITHHNERNTEQQILFSTIFNPFIQKKNVQEKN